MRNVSVSVYYIKCFDAARRFFNDALSMINNKIIYMEENHVVLQFVSKTTGFGFYLMPSKLFKLFTREVQNEQNEHIYFRIHVRGNGKLAFRRF